MRSGNPVLGAQTFTGLAPSTDRMTIQGTVVKSLVLLLFVMVSATWIWNRFYSGASGTMEPAQLERSMAAIYPWILGGTIGGLAVALVTIFKKPWAGLTAPIYALLEGLVLGGLSAMFEARFPGIVLQAVGLT